MSGFDNTSYTLRTVATAGITLTNQDSVIVASFAGAKAVAMLGGSLVQPGRSYTFVNGATGTCTLTPNTGTINGGATYVIPAGAMASIISDGTNWVVTQFSAGPLT